MPEVRTWKPEEHGGAISLCLILSVLLAAVCAIWGFLIEKPNDSLDRKLFSVVRLLSLEDDSQEVGEQTTDNATERKDQQEAENETAKAREAEEADRIRRGEWWFQRARSFVLLSVVLGILGLGFFLYETFLVSFRLTTTWSPLLICGLGDIGIQLTRNLRTLGRSVIVVEPDTENPRLAEAARLGALIVIGDARQRSILEKAQVKRVSEVFIVTGSDMDNVETAMEIGEIRKDRTAPVTCHVHLSESRLAGAVSEHLKRTKFGPTTIKTFHMYRQVAQQMIIRHLSRPGIRPEPGETPLYVLIGFGKRGQGMATQLAELAIFDIEKRSRMIVITRNAREAAQEFRAQWGTFSPELPRVAAETEDETPTTIADVRFDDAADSWDSKALRPGPAYQIANDCEILADYPQGIAIEYVMNAVFVEHPGYLAEATFANNLSKLMTARGIRPTIICCEDNDSAAFTDAETLQDGMAQGLLARVPVLAWISRHDGLRKLIDVKLPENFLSFGPCAELASYEAISQPLMERLGREIKRDYENGKREKAAAAVPGAKFQPLTDTELDAAWKAEDEVFQQSNLSAGAHALVKLALLGWQVVPREKLPCKKCSGEAVARVMLPPGEELRLAKIEHLRWVSERLMAGTLWGPEKNKCPPRRPQICTWEALEALARTYPELHDEPNKDLRQVRWVFEKLSEWPEYVFRPIEPFPPPRSPQAEG